MLQKKKTLSGNEVKCLNDNHPIAVISLHHENILQNTPALKDLYFLNLPMILEIITKTHTHWETKF